jgi:hypothetical protein
MPSFDKPSRQIAIILLGTILLSYAADYAVLQLKMKRNNGAAALGSVTSYYGTVLKDGKMEIFTDQPQVETCVHSLFPHSGYRPCWYASRNNVKPIG